VVNSVVDEARPQAEHENIELCSAPVPALEVACPAGILTVVITNLINNAIKFMGDSKVRRINVQAQAYPQSVHVSVEDTGPGLPVDFQELAFLPYARAAANVPGLGLGLATVKRLIEAHRGRVGVQSDKGTGAVFWFELPRAAA
jgi:signal transduction histidine kinase